MIRHLYTKIFLWFWVATIGVALSAILIAGLTGAQPLGQRWMTRTLDYYGNSAVDFYLHSGTPTLERYLDDIDRNSAIHAALLDPDSHDILARGIPPGGQSLLAAARASGTSQFHIGLRWTGVSVIPRPEGTFFFVAQIRPMRGFFTPALLSAHLIRLAFALLSAGLLCFLLARHIASPIRTLQIAAGRIANGDLSIRATPAMAPRSDELADLARDFDLMAARIQSLLQKQHELLGDISHELRSPLTRLGLSLELVRRGETGEVERMQAELDRLDDLIGQILTLTRLQSLGTHDLTTPVNLRSLLEGVAEDARFEGQPEKKSVEIAHADDCWLNGDSALLRSCMENVVRNAIRYTPPCTAVVISLNLLNGAIVPTARILIADDGDGVPTEALPRLFEPFYRVSASRERSSGGAGLGLSIASRVVSLHRGTISARNRLHGGLEVEIALPASAGEHNSV